LPSAGQLAFELRSAFASGRGRASRRSLHLRRFALRLRRAPIRHDGFDARVRHYRANAGLGTTVAEGRSNKEKSMKIERQGPIAILKMNLGKANAMDRVFLEQLHARLIEIEQSDARALVVTGYESFFSAGLHLPSLIDLDRVAMRQFMEVFGNAMLRLFCLPLPVVAGVNGHAIAGGCVLALQADWRVMVQGPFRMGLNETMLGISLPPTVLEPLRLQLVPSSWLPVALEGRLFAPEEALEVGLVDKLVARDELLAVALVRAEALARVPQAAYGRVKLALRRQALALIEKTREREAELWLDGWFGATAQSTLRAAVAKLGGGAR